MTTIISSKLPGKEQPGSLKNRLTPEQDDLHIFPVINCPKCRRKNIPVAYLGTVKLLPYTLCCHRILDTIKPIGYASLLDLEETGWDEHL